MISRRFGMGAALAVAPLLFIGQGASAQSLPLLDQASIRSPLMAGCEGKPDSTPLPVDPRSLVKAGVNSNPNAAIQFNAYFVDLHNPPPPFVNRLPPRPTTCGQFRASATRGRINLQERQFFQPMALAISYHFIYQQWGYLVRPPDFEEQVAKRYGLYPAPFRNPYPLPGEDPNKTNGGSGQLPLGLMLPLIVESALCLEGAVVASAPELDMALLLGVGLPSYLGGALKYADWLGLERVIELSERYAALGPQYQATPAMRSMARERRKYY